MLTTSQKNACLRAVPLLQERYANLVPDIVRLTEASVNPIDAQYLTEAVMFLAYPHRRRFFVGPFDLLDEKKETQKCTDYATAIIKLAHRYYSVIA